MAAILLAASNAAQAQDPSLQQRFEKKVQEYEAGDQKSPPPPGAILFAGDSQFNRWTTIREDLPGYTLINRGIDSFQFQDLLRYFDRPDLGFVDLRDSMLTPDGSRARICGSPTASIPTTRVTLFASN